MATVAGDQIDRQCLIDAIISIKFRAEKQPDSINSIDSFVPIVDPNLLATPNTQIIYGRNGTGKTHLLRAFYNHCEEDFENNKLLPVYIDCRDLDLGNASPITPDDLVIRFYRRFLYKVIDRLREASASLITVPFLQKVFGGDGQERKSKIDEHLGHLSSILDMGQIEELVKGYYREIKLEQGGLTKVEGKANVGVQTSILNPLANIGVGVGLSVEDTQRDNEKIELVYRGLSVIDYNSIRDDLEVTIDLCGARAIVILVDEWSSVSLSIQPILAEMIRKTLAVSNKIFLKIVSLKFFTKTSAMVSPPQRIGFQMGSDITQLVDLDQLLSFDNNQQIVTDILTLIAYKHICLEYSDLKRYSVKQFADYLCTEIFEDVLAYREVARASEGNPRDFLTILSVCCNLGYKISKETKITSDKARGAAANHFLENKFPEISDRPDANDLFNKIFLRVVRNKSKLFLISTKKAASDLRILELWHNRFIHLVSQSYSVLDENYTPFEYAIYSLDNGKLLPMKRDKKGEEVLEKIERGLEIYMAIIKYLSPDTDMLRRYVEATLLALLEQPIVRNPVKERIGSYFVKREEIEAANLADADYLVKTCVIDDLLDNT